MGGMRFDHHGAAGSEGGRGVPAGHGEGEREVACAEYGHWAERDIAQAQIRARQRRAAGQRRVDPHIQPGAVPHDGGEQPKLANRAPALALDAAARQGGFGHRLLDQLVAEFEDAGGHRFQEGRALLQSGLAEAVECGPGQRTGAADILRAGFAIGRVKLRAGGGVDCPKCLGLARSVRCADERLSS